MKGMILKMKKRPDSSIRNNEISFLMPLFYGFYIVLSTSMAHHMNRTDVIGTSDFIAHNEWGRNILDNGFDLSNLYWNMIAFIALLLNAEIGIASQITVFLLKMAFIVPVHFFVQKYLPMESASKWTVFVVAIIGLAGSIPNLYGPHLFYFYGAGVNLWHNPTTFAVMPFAVISFFLFCQAIMLADTKDCYRINGGGAELIHYM